MENNFFLNVGGFKPSNSPPSWQSLSSSAMEIQTQDCFFTSTDHSHSHALHFDSALSSIVSSPASPPNNNHNDSFLMRELIGKLGTIGGNSSCENENEISISPHSYTTTNNTSCYNTPLNSPPKPISLNNSSNVAEFSAADPGFAERAAKFSCFGSRSFNDRKVAELVSAQQRSVENNGKKLQLQRVSSSPSLKTFGGGSQIENKNSPQERIMMMMMEVANSQEESTISEQSTPIVETGVKTSHDLNSRKRKSSSSKGKAFNSSNPTKGVEGGGEDSNAKRSKPNEGEGNENGTMNMEEESKGGTTTNAGEEKLNKSNSKPPEPPKDYIHVRARRGQATDSHSLAERVRREKISERMKLLQDLVPGCNKVTGKALMLDEIINYVQSLQRQVEFLSMKLSSVNTRMDLSIESIISKDTFQSNNSLQQPIFPIDSSTPSFYGQQPQQNPAILNNMPNRTLTHCLVDPLDSSLCQNIGMHLPPLNGFNEGGSQFPLTFSEEDLHTIVQMGFGQTANRKTPIQSPSFNGSNQASSQMKVEL